jgi:8-oxo-dGTP diphosphatase
LSPKGSRQAEALLEHVDPTKVGIVVSSPAQRCIETVEPIAERADTKVRIRKELLEGADPEDAVALLLELAPSTPVLCSHGDLVPKMIRRLVAEGMKTKDANVSQKGSLWIIEIEKGRPTRGRYHPPA